MRVISLSITLLLLSSIAHADWYFRGTPNQWGSEAMIDIENSLVYTCQTFSGNGARFKISRQQNWHESYPEEDYEVADNQSYLIVFNTDSKAFSVTAVNSCDDSLAFPTNDYRPPRGPYLQSMTDSGVIVRWQSKITGGVATLRYGTEPTNLNTTVYGSSNGIERTVQLQNLQANTRYYYAVGLSENTSIIDSHMRFDTPTHTGSREALRIWVTGDTGDIYSGNGAVLRVYDAFMQASEGLTTHAWLMLGDNAYGDGYQHEYQRHLFNAFPELLKQTPLWPTYGNHDAHSASASRQSGPYFDIFNLPSNAEAGGVASGNEAYFSFNLGNIHFVNLDSAESAGRNGPTMKAWLEQDLAANAADINTDWLIAFFHHPPYSKGSHDSDNENDVDGTNDTWGGRSEMFLMRENFIPILEKYSVDLVLSGHSHSYERSMLIGGHYGESDEFLSNPLDFARNDHDNRYTKPIYANHDDHYQEGSIYVVAGSAAKNNGNGGLNHPVMMRGMKDYGSLILNVEGLNLSATMLTDAGETKDQFTLEKTIENWPPVAVISPRKTRWRAEDILQYSGANSYDPDGEIISYTWTLNGESFGTTESVNLGTLDVGDYALNLEVADENNVTHTKEISFTVSTDPIGNFPTLFLRGTFNQWGVHAMQLLEDSIWRTEINLLDGDEFKFDVHQDWSQNYGDDNTDYIGDSNGNNIVVAESGRYLVTFNDETLVYSVVRIGNYPSYNSDFSSVSFRGTPNDWERSAMRLVDDYTWQIETEFSSDDPRFKFFARDRWYGDTNNDGETHSNEYENIRITEGGGRYRIRLIDNIRRYSIEKL